MDTRIGSTKNFPGLVAKEKSVRPLLKWSPFENSRAINLTERIANSGTHFGRSPRRLVLFLQEKSGIFSCSG
jgi:hypothetical protein